MRRVGIPSALLGRERKILRYDGEIPEAWAGRGRWTAGPMHTFVDDYRQEFFWRRPEEGAVIAALAGMVTAPDYTSYTDDPAEWRGFQGWRSALVAAYWQSLGVVVLPVMSFRTGVHRYVECGATWAVRSPRPQHESAWRADLEVFLEDSLASRVVVFGRRIALDLDIPVLWRGLRAVSSKGQKQGCTQRGRDGRSIVAG